MKRVIYIILSLATLGVAGLLLWKWYKSRNEDSDMEMEQQQPNKTGFPLLSALVSASVQGVAKITKCMGNIRVSSDNWDGLTGSYQGFASFADWAYGTRATLKTLLTYYDKHGLKTISQIINRWAPAADNNNPEQYATAVSLWAKKGVDTPLSKSDLPLICACMCRMETGIPESNFEALKQHVNEVNAYFRIV